MIPPHKLTKSCRRHAIAILSTTTCCLRQTDSLSKLVNLAQNAQTPQLDLFHFLRCPACSTTVTIFLVQPSHESCRHESCPFSFVQKALGDRRRCEARDSCKSLLFSTLYFLVCKTSCLAPLHVCLDCVPREPVILEAPAPIAPAPHELSNPDLSLCYAMHPGMKCACKGVELRC